MEANGDAQSQGVVRRKIPPDSTTLWRWYWSLPDESQEFIEVSKKKLILK